MTRKEARERCGLCGKTKDQVRKLIVGLEGAACSDCISLCIDILADPGRKSEAGSDWDGALTLDNELRKFYLSPEQTKAALRSYLLQAPGWKLGMYSEE